MRGLATMSDQSTTYSMGMVFVGFTLATWLFGVNSMQAYMYFRQSKDGFLLKLTVVIVFLSDLLNTIFNCWGLYSELAPVVHVPLQGNIPMVLQTMAADVAIFIVQCFFAHTVWQVSMHALWLTSLIGVLAFLAFAAGIGLTALSVISIYLAGGPLPVLNEVFVGLALGLVTLTDIVITAALTVYFVNGKSSIGSTSNLLEKLILYCIQRGILTTISHVIVLVLWFTLPTEWTWTILQFSLGKVYTLTFLVLLNKRDSLRSTAQDDNGRSDAVFPLSTIEQPLTKQDVEDGGNKSNRSITPSVAWPEGV